MGGEQRDLPGGAGARREVWAGAGERHRGSRLTGAAGIFQALSRFGNLLRRVYYCKVCARLHAHPKLPSPGV